MIKVKRDWYKDFFDSFLVDMLLERKNIFKVAERDVDFLINKLKIKKTHKILDVPCGKGRHSLIFAKKGYKVTGVDISSSCIRGARERIRKNFSKNITFHKGNMIDLKKFKGEYDVVLNMWTSIGYFRTDRENERVIKNLITSLKGGGKLCIGNVANRDVIMKRFMPKSWNEFEKYYLLEEREYEPKTKYMNNLWTIIPKNGGRARKYPFRVRFYGVNEIVKLMKRNGLKDIKLYGSLKGERFSKIKSHHPVFVGTKK